jgi:hypothetical protein
MPTMTFRGGVVVVRVEHTSVYFIHKEVEKEVGSSR